MQVSDHYDEIVENIAGYRGPQPGVYVLTGPDHQGSVPLGMRQIKVRTRLAVIAIRVLVRGEDDLPGSVSLLSSARYSARKWTSDSG